MRRRRRRNPVGLLPVVLGLAAAGGVAFFLLKKKKSPASLVSSTGTHFVTEPSFTTGLPASEVKQFRTGDCVVAVQGQAGFRVPGSVPDGENTILKVVQGDPAGATLVATSTDTRVTAAAGATFDVPAAALSGGGDCAV